MVWSFETFKKPSAYGAIGGKSSLRAMGKFYKKVIPSHLKMSLKCPACGFDSPEGAAFCDMCKEPFKKKGSAAVVDEMKKLTPEEPLKRVADELAKDKK